MARSGRSRVLGPGRASSRGGYATRIRYRSLRNGDRRIGCHVAGKHDVAINSEIATVTLDHTSQDFDVYRQAILLNRDEATASARHLAPQHNLPDLDLPADPVFFRHCLVLIRPADKNVRTEAARVGDAAGHFSAKAAQCRRGQEVDRSVLVARAETARSDGVERLEN